MPNPLFRRLPAVLAGSAVVLVTASGGAWTSPRPADADFGDQSDTNGAWCVHRVDEAPVALSGLAALQAVSWALASPACQSAGDLT